MLFVNSAGWTKLEPFLRGRMAYILIPLFLLAWQTWFVDFSSYLPLGFNPTHNPKCQ